METQHLQPDETFYALANQKPKMCMNRFAYMDKHQQHCTLACYSMHNTEREKNWACEYRLYSYASRHSAQTKTLPEGVLE